MSKHAEGKKDNGIGALKKYHDLLDAEIFSQLEGIDRKLAKDLAATCDQDRALRIAIIGQMKAGKSSLLNAIFFKENVLPEAATPMTAALTKIIFGDDTKAEVHFYSKDEWQQIENSSAQYRSEYSRIYADLIDDSNKSPLFNNKVPLLEPSKTEIESRIAVDVKACFELTEKAKLAGLDVSQYLGKTQILNVDVKNELRTALEDYVGSNGRFTALTKSTVLHINDERLRDIEVIDTPGFNDPILSRGKITREHLGQCDVVILLSHMDSFFGKADVSLLREQISTAGINKKAVYVIGSQRDKILRGDRQLLKEADNLANLSAKQNPNVDMAALRAAAQLHLVNIKAQKRMVKMLSEYKAQNGSDPALGAIYQALSENKVISVAAYFALVAEQMDNLTETQKDQLLKLRQATQCTYERQDLLNLSNIPAVEKLIEQQKASKSELLASKETQLRMGAESTRESKLKELAVSTNERMRQVRDTDLTELEATAKQTRARIANGRATLEDIFDEQATAIKLSLIQLVTEVRAAASQFKNVEVKKDVTTDSYNVSTSDWYNPFSWGSSETRYREVVTIYASAQDAIENVENYVNESLEKLQNTLRNSIDIESMRKKIANAILELFDTSDANFDAQALITQVKKSLRKITVPDTSFGHTDYAEIICTEFGSTKVNEGAIESLKAAQRKIISDIMKDLKKEIDEKIKTISNSLEETSNTFVSSLLEDIEEQSKILQHDIKHREETLSRLSVVSSIISSMQKIAYSSDDMYVAELQD